MSYDKNGKLTRAGMEAAIAAGGTVLHKGKIIASVDRLPSEAELAETPEDKAKAGISIDEQIAALQAQKAKLAGPVVPKSNSVDELDDLKKDDLLALAKKENVDVDSTATKAVIVDAIRAKRNPAT